ncbi:phosphatidylinositol-glycan biosynthesis class X protein [Fopius arisanus]|uniref:Phosphatidylinositol-glycan biosynthesis class X protein n=1 Tax=Fopius arisanus TaxID=64838 RepID=A0A9R1TGW4_9HYME|nr:PREDICTED: phosphatidylinositol-glycan biosynthesis class X protein [Fopius arisanus]
MKMLSIEMKIVPFVINIFTLLIFFSPTNSDLLDSTVDFHIDGDGFHRKIFYFVDIPNLRESDCHVALVVELPQSLYVNVDELADLRRTGEVTACSEGETDVEIFAEEAKPQSVTICSALNETNSILSLPVHQRYHRARKGGDFLSVIFPTPKLLLGCKNRVKEYPVSKMDLCAPCVDLSIKWREIPYETRTKPYEWKIPVGDSSQRHFVTCITLFVTSVGTIWVLKTLWRSSSNRRRKID